MHLLELLFIALQSIFHTNFLSMFRLIDLIRWIYFTVMFEFVMPRMALLYIYCFLLVQTYAISCVFEKKKTDQKELKQKAKGEAYIATLHPHGACLHGSCPPLRLRLRPWWLPPSFTMAGLSDLSFDPGVHFDRIAKERFGRSVSQLLPHS